MILWFYRVFFLPLFLFSLPYYCYRMLKRGGYGRHFSHRFGLLPKIEKRQKRIWIQAVSVGEVRALKPLVEQLLKTYPVEIFLTTTTSTGLRLAESLFQEKVTCIGVFPLNFWLFSRTAWNRVDPDYAILTESELWPEHLAQAQKRDVPLYLVNARMSEKSFRRYSKVRFVSRWLLKHLDYVLASSEESKARFIALGCPENQIETVGNLKLDYTGLLPLSAEDISGLKTAFGFPENAQVIFGVSTWPGEERMLANILKSLRLYTTNLCLVLLPRHPERKREIQEDLSSTEFSFSFRTEPRDQQNDIYVADTIGEIQTLIQTADIVFVGKSMHPHNGGQSPVDAALFGKPILYGPNMQNFRNICQSLEGKGAAFVCQNEEALEHFCLKLLQTPELREEIGQKALSWQQANQGATWKILKYFESILT